MQQLSSLWGKRQRNRINNYYEGKREENIQNLFGSQYLQYACSCQRSINIYRNNISRDMGYNVSLMADSTTRWAEALKLQFLKEEFPLIKVIQLTQHLNQHGFMKELVKQNAQDHQIEKVRLLLLVSPAGGEFSDIQQQQRLQLLSKYSGVQIKDRLKKAFPINQFKHIIFYNDYKKQIHPNQL